MRAWMRHGMWGVVVGIVLPGCSTTCGWFGRNSDCSNNCWGKKPNPVQQGPLAGTYTQPNNANMTVSPANGQMPTNGQPMNGRAVNGQMMSPGQANAPYQQAPVISTIPPAAPGMNGMPASPLNTPAQFPTNGGGNPPTSLQSLPPAEFNPNPSAIPMLTNSMVTANGPVIPQPEVKGPPILDLTVPGANTAKKTDASDAMRPSPFPMVGVPPESGRSVRVVDTPIAPPNIPGPPALTAPTIAGPETMPRETKTPAMPPPLPQVPPPPPMLN